MINSFYSYVVYKIVNMETDDIMKSSEVGYIAMYNKYDMISDDNFII